MKGTVLLLSFTQMMLGLDALRLFMSTEKLTVQPIKQLNGEVTLPGSKSLSNRVLLLAALSEGETKIDNLLDSADTQYMLGALKQLKVPVDVDLKKKIALIKGHGGPFNTKQREEIFLGKPCFKQP